MKQRLLCAPCECEYACVVYSYACFCSCVVVALQHVLNYRNLLELHDVPRSREHTFTHILCVGELAKKAVEASKVWLKNYIFGVFFSNFRVGLKLRTTNC